MARLSINGKQVTVPDSMTILEAAMSHGIKIPHLCHHPQLTPFGGCRLCVVQVTGMPKPVASCTTAVTDGMEVTISSPEIDKHRKMVLELILSDHPNDCMTCEATGSCALQELAYEYGARGEEYAGERRVYKKRDGNPFIERDLEKCILCGRCVKVCDDVQGVQAIDFGYRGFTSKIVTPYEDDLDCEFCGQCVAVCPTGALTGKQWSRKGRYEDVKTVDTACPYCGTGCMLTVHVKTSSNEITRVSSKPWAGNEGWLCVKGRFGYQFVKSPDRLTKPLIRRESGAFEETSWTAAIEYTANWLRQVRENHGADAIGGLSSARCTNEENYLFQKFMRAAVGTNNVDHCARL
jgi:predicted molibdopterin-dependent oxidoreductase YjgC